MGCRLHIAKKYTIEFADKNGFNWKEEEFKHLLRTLNAYISDSDGYSPSFEIEKSDFKYAILTLKDYYNLKDEPSQEDVDDCIRSLVEMSDFNFDIDSARKYVIKELEEYLAESDPDNNCMYFSFF